MMSDVPPRLWPDLTVDEFQQWWSGDAPLLWGGVAFDPPTDEDERRLIERGMAVDGLVALGYCRGCFSASFGHAWALWCVATQRPYITVTKGACQAVFQSIVAEMFSTRRLLDPTQFDELNRYIGAHRFAAAFLSSSFVAIHAGFDVQGTEIANDIGHILNREAKFVFFGEQRYG